MKRFYDDSGYERYNDYPREHRGGMDEYPNYWYADDNDLESQYRAAGMVLHNGVWVMPHQVEDDNA